MKQFTLSFLLYLACFSATAQFIDHDSADKYIADTKTYVHASELLHENHAQEAVKLLDGLIEEREKESNYSKSQLGEFYFIRARGNSLLGENIRAINDCKRSIELMKEAGNEGKKDVEASWYLLACIYYAADMLEESLQAADSCVAANTEYFGENHSNILKAYDLRSNIAGFCDNKTIALKDRQKIFRLIKTNIIKNFVYLTEDERSGYWNKYIPYLSHNLTFAHMMKNYDGTMADELYNQQLLTKSLLLSTESALQRAIDNDSELKTTYKTIRNLRSKAASNDLTKAQAQKAALEADKLERELGTKAQSLQQFTSFMDIETKDIKQQLKKEDIAIEFADYRIGKDSIMYAAIILSPQWEHARFLPLAEEKEINSNKENLSTVIWQPIIRTLDYTPKNIFFSPSGILYQLPIESQAQELKDVQLQQTKLYRLSSTRQLAVKDNTEKGKGAVIYGGLTYNMSIKNMEKDAATYNKKRSVGHYNRKFRDGITELKELPGTKAEAENIAKAINSSRDSSMKAEILVGKKGTETSFKNLDGQGKRMIHIATHGFYDAPKNKEDVSLNSALDRCGLFFAGADNKINEMEIPTGTDDGILTAREVSELDLSKLDLVVLSACETGIGQISSDGVFGLQRGFKKAGANSIVMSLWKVDDDATSFLMTQFYKNLMKGATKNDALQKAQNSVRQNKNWDQPFFWAGFILLDGLD